MPTIGECDTPVSIRSRTGGAAKTVWAKVTRQTAGAAVQTAPAQWVPTLALAFQGRPPFDVTDRVTLPDDTTEYVIAESLFDRAAWETLAITATQTSVTVAYTRGGTTAEVVAQVTGESADVRTPGGTPQSLNRLDRATRVYLVPAWSLAAALGTGAMPVVGDQVTETLGGVACRFEIVRQDGDRAWKWADPARRQVFELHMKPVA